jgi:hypothetical protein
VHELGTIMTMADLNHRVSEERVSVAEATTIIERLAKEGHRLTTPRQMLGYSRVTPNDAEAAVCVLDDRPKGG